jgi:hypothetical protein
VPTTRDRRLEPVRRPRWPRGSTVARAALVAALLLTAAAVLYGGPSTPPPSGRRPPGAPPSPTPAPPSDRPAGGSLPIPPGTVGVPVRISEPATLTVLRPGDRVDLLAMADAAAKEPVTIAKAALVLAVPAGADEHQAVVYLALSASQAREAVTSPPGVRFAVIVRAG